MGFRRNSQSTELEQTFQETVEFASKVESSCSAPLLLQVFQPNLLAWPFGLEAAEDFRITHSPSRRVR
jgi:hypothetical protein